MQTTYAEDVARRWGEIDESLAGDDLLSTGIKIGILARYRERVLASSLSTFGSRGVRTMEDYRLLALTTRIDPLAATASEASTVVGLSKAATAVRFERFESDGLVTREVREFDRRIVEVRITPAGRKLAVDCTHAVKDAYGRVLEHFDSAELNDFRTLLGKIQTNQI